ncbi:hypothetical protein [Hydrogenophaga sp.]|uniref:hypothetical protein n=1 Tax=Hydrogenophaga sp. TaxID=1904254 RepID=UPI00271F628C|nr:hypothetical protein [Hydrogenophaga sp.]MDO9435603.1 hypothetical protein [Hydrogenophaga sp.]
MRVTAQSASQTASQNVQSPPLIDYQLSSRKHRVQLLVEGNGRGQPRLNLRLEGTEACTDVAAFIRNQWSIPSDQSIVMFTYCARVAYTEGEHDKPSKPTSMQEALDAVRASETSGRIDHSFLVMFQEPPIVKQSASSSKSYVDPSGAPVNVKPGTAATALAPQGAKAAPAADYKTPHAERPLETVFRSAHGQVTKLYVGGSEKLRDLVDALKAEWGVAANLQADITLNGARVISDIALYRQRVQDAQLQHRPLDVRFADNTAGLHSLALSASSNTGEIALSLAVSQ